MEGVGAALGWYQDPYHRHEERYFSQGRPTKLVRDQRRESFDPPPDAAPPGPLLPLPVPETVAGWGSADLHRADECEREPAFDRRDACDTAINAVVRHGIAG